MRQRFVPRQLFAAVMGGVLLSGCVGGEPRVNSYGPGTMLPASHRNTAEFLYALPIGKVPVTIEGKIKLPST